MATVKVNEEETAAKYMDSPNLLTYEPLFVVNGYTTIEFTEYVKISSRLIIAFNPN